MHREIACNRCGKTTNYKKCIALGHQPSANWGHCDVDHGPLNSAMHVIYIQENEEQLSRMHERIRQDVEMSRKIFLKLADWNFEKCHLCILQMEATEDIKEPAI